jgi:formylglycine-generating enzyme required for sulfatase activity
MSFTSVQLRTARSILSHENDSFVQLTWEAGLNPKTAFIDGDLRGIHVDDDDVSGFVFSGTDLRGADFSLARGKDQATFADCIIDDSTKGLDGQLFRGPEMVHIPPGSYNMGVPASESSREYSADEASRPVHKVTIRRGFYVGKYPVTRGEYSQFVTETNRHHGTYRDHPGWHNPGFAQVDCHPAVYITAADAEAYVDWLSLRTGRGYRLLSESEWEYAARAGTTTARYWGDSSHDSSSYAWYGKATGQDAGTASVFERLPNAFGIHDILGNVAEWTLDAHNENYDGAPNDGSAWKDGDKSRRVIRGGAWIYGPKDMRCGYRSFVRTDFRSNYLGFRVAR